MACFSEERYRELLQKVYLLAELKSGKTLSVHEMTVVEHNLITSWYRWFHSEDRNKSISEIFAIVDEVNRFIPCLKDHEEQRKNMYVALIEARKGIASLLDTYKDDAKICSSVNTILSELQRISGSFQWNTGVRKNYSFTGLPHCENNSLD